MSVPQTLNEPCVQSRILRFFRNMLGKTKVHKMDGERKNFVRFRPQLDSQISMGSESDTPLQSAFSIDSTAVRRSWQWQKSSVSFFKLGNTLLFKSSPQDMPEESKWYYVLDPASPALHRWNTFFLISCLVAVFIDPLYFYLPKVNYDRSCITISRDLQIAVTVFRTITDFFYVVHMGLRFWTGFIPPSTRVFGRGELVTDRMAIAKRYCKYDFWVDFVAVLPIPQVDTSNQVWNFSISPFSFLVAHRLFVFLGIVI